MEVILLERVEKLGQMGDVVRVKPGFARNFLLPRKKALRATKENLAVFEGQRKQLEAQNLERRKEAEKVASALAGKSVVMIRSAGESGQLYGSVTARDIAQAVTAEGVTIDRSQVVLTTPIKSLGLHKTRIALHPEVSETVIVNVARSEDEARRQAQTGRAVTSEEEEEALEPAPEAFFETPPPTELSAEDADASEAEAVSGDETPEGEEKSA